MPGPVGEVALTRQAESQPSAPWWAFLPAVMAGIRQPSLRPNEVRDLLVEGIGTDPRHAFTQVFPPSVQPIPLGSAPASPLSFQPQTLAEGLPPFTEQLGTHARRGFMGEPRAVAFRGGGGPRAGEVQRVVGNLERGFSPAIGPEDIQRVAGEMGLGRLSADVLSDIAVVIRPLSRLAALLPFLDFPDLLRFLQLQAGADPRFGPMMGPPRA